MGISGGHPRIALYIGLVLMTQLVTGCAGIEPYEARDHREEGPEKGLFSGEAGEFVIFRRDKVAKDQVPESPR